MMRRYGTMNLLFNKAGEGDGSGGGSGSLLNTGGNSSSGQVPPAKGSEGGEGGGNKSGGDSNAAGSAGATSWISALPKELQEDATLKKFTDVQGLAQSYINAQKLIGADKIAIPSKHATDEEWKQVFEKLGLPAPDKYEVKFGDQATIDKKFSDDFKVQAHKLGILPKQAQGLADWFTQMNAGSEAEILKQHEENTAKEIKGLREEWGKAFDQKVRFANNVLEKFGSKELVEYLGKTGLANSVPLTKFLSQLGESMFKEGTIPDSGQPTSGITPAEAKKQYLSIIGNPDHPYHIKSHPGHKAAVEEVSKLIADSIVKSS